MEGLGIDMDNICPLCLSGTLLSSCISGDSTLVCSTCGECLPVAPMVNTRMDIELEYQIKRMGNE